MYKLYVYLIAGSIALAVIFMGAGLHAAQPLKIGVILARTGNAALDSKNGFEAAEYAAQIINAKGGILHRPVELVELDNESTALGSRKAALEAVKKGVCGVVGAVWSSHSIAMARVLQKYGIPMISPSSTSPDLTLMGNYIFRICFNDNFQGKVMANFALNYLNAQNAVVLTNSSSKYSIGLSDAFIRQFSRKGSVIWQSDYIEGTTNFLSFLEKIKNLNADVIFVPDHFRESGFIIKQARSMGISTIFLGGDGWLNQMYKYGGSAIEGNYYSAQWHYLSCDPVSRAFVRKYAKNHKSAAHPVVALVYDAVMLMADAVKRAGSSDHRAIRDAIAATSGFHGVTGPIKFDANGDPVNKPAVILKFENNDSVYFRLVKP